MTQLRMVSAIGTTNITTLKATAPLGVMSAVFYDWATTEIYTASPTRPVPSALEDL